MFHWSRAAIPLLCLVFCSRPEEGPRYISQPPRQTARRILAVHPLHNPAMLLAAYGPLAEYLSSRIPEVQFHLEASRDYGTFEEKYRSRGPDFILPNPYQTLEAIRSGYHVIAMAGDPHDFYGIILVRKDSNIRTFADLRGQSVSYPAATALAACIMPQFFLHRNGVSVRDLDNRYVGSQESSIMNVYGGHTAAGVTWPPPWRAFQREHPAEAAALKVMWATEPLINNSFMARDDVPPALTNRVRELLLGLQGQPEGAAILAQMETSRFLPAQDADYAPVREYIAQFEREVRPVKR